VVSSDVIARVRLWNPLRSTLRRADCGGDRSGGEDMPAFPRGERRGDWARDMVNDATPPPQSPGEHMHCTWKRKTWNHRGE
jgi:hypothetical protein